MSHSIVQLFVRSVVENKVGIAVRNLVVEFMCPWLVNHGEVLVSESTKDYDLVLNLALH